MNPYFFNSSSGQSLFGAYHPPRRVTSQPRAVVICPPIGQEYIRSHWSLRLLAGQLARRGIHTLRFDYSGIGDSTCSIEDIENSQQWLSDIESASQFLQERSQAGSVMLLGLRTGATLANLAAQTLETVHALMLWEPVQAGSLYLQQLRSMHREMLDLWNYHMTTPDNEQYEEILGSRYRRSLIDEIENWEIDWGGLSIPHMIFDLQDHQSQYSNRLGFLGKTEFINDQYSWADLNQLESAWLRPQTAKKIVASAVDTFDRLQKFNLLIGSAHA